MLDIFTWGGADTLVWLFEGIKLLTDTGGDMGGVLRLLFLISALVVAVEIAFTGKLQPTARLFAFILIFNVALVAKTDVMIVDEVRPADTQLVDQVPAGLAWIASLSSTMGKWATDRFENVFAAFDPNYVNLQFRGNGMLLGSRIMQSSTEFTITDPRMAENLSEFAEQCIYYGSMVGWFTFQDLTTTNNVWAFLGGNTLGNAVFTPYRDGAGVTTLEGCRDAWGLLDADWNAAINDGASVYGQKLFSSLNPVDAQNALLATIPQSYQALANVADNSAGLIRQNMMLNTMRRSYSRLAASAGANAVVQDYALAVAERQQRTTYNTLGALAGRTLPLMRNVFEVLIYGLFPIIIFLILISHKQAETIFFYIKSVFWLQLWAPLYALLNFIVTNYAGKITAAAAQMPNAGGANLTLLTQSGMGAVNADMMSMAGYLAWIIPILSWSLVSKGGFAASQMASGIGSVAQGSGASASSEAARGNINMGNMSTGNTSMFQTNTAPRSMRHVGSTDTPGGPTIYTASGGGAVISALMGNSPLKSTLNNAMSSGARIAAQEAQSAQIRDAQSYMSGISGSIGRLAKLDQAVRSGISQGSEWTHGASAGKDSAFGKMMESANNFRSSVLHSADKKAEFLAAAQADPMALRVMSAGNLAAKFGLSASNGEALRDEINAAKAYADKNNFTQKFSDAQSAGYQIGARALNDSSSGISNDVVAGLRRDAGRTEAFETSRARSAQIASTAENVESQGASTGFDISQQAAMRAAGNNANAAAKLLQTAYSGRGKEADEAQATLVRASIELGKEKAMDIGGMQSPPTGQHVADLESQGRSEMAGRPSENGISSAANGAINGLINEAEGRGLSSQKVEAAHSDTKNVADNLRSSLAGETATRGAEVESNVNVAANNTADHINGVRDSSTMPLRVTNAGLRDAGNAIENMIEEGVDLIGSGLQSAGDAVTGGMEAAGTFVLNGMEVNADGSKANTNSIGGLQNSSPSVNPRFLSNEDTPEVPTETAPNRASGVVKRDE